MSIWLRSHEVSGWGLRIMSVNESELKNAIRWITSVGLKHVLWWRSRVGLRNVIRLRIRVGFKECCLIEN